VENPFNSLDYFVVDNHMHYVDNLADSLWKYNYFTSVFHWNVTIWLVMKWSHDYKRNPNLHVPPWRRQM